jgi:putative endonuclease
MMGFRRHRGILPRTGQLSVLTAMAHPCNLVRVSTDPRHQRGTASEQLAAAYLQTQGLVVVAQNLRCRAGELDLVCLDRDVLAIVEVRQRGHLDFGGPLASVDRRKQHKIIRAARFLIRGQPQWRSHAMRFDVVGIEGLPDGTYRIAWIKDAFRAT